MITFKQYLQEEKTDLVAFLKANCQQAVNEMWKTDHCLWRGADKRGFELFQFGDTELEGYTGTVRENRKPRNTPKWAHDTFNKFFQREFGHPLRSDALFTYAARSYAGGYGSTFAIIPIGSYDIYWSPKVDDLTHVVFPDIDEDEPDEKILAGGVFHWIKDAKVPLADVTREMQVDHVNSFLKDAGYTHDSNEAALKTKNELMVVCKSYLALSVSEKEMREIITAAHG